MEKFVCNHCGNRFEHELAESLVCPKCFWSTSVKPENEEKHTEGAASPMTAAVPQPSAFEPPLALETRNSGGLLRWAGGILFVLFFIGIIIFALGHVKKQDEILHKIETKNAQEIAAQAPELALTPGRQEILNRVVSADPKRPISEKEKEVLSPRFSFRSRAARGIPTTPWTEKEFDEFLKTQQANYRVPLGWSYERKLKEIFKTYSLAGAYAFEAKDYLKARDEWIRSLAVPVYQNNVSRHRGVVLTMLRPYINDTLAKIGAMNTTLVGTGFADFETEIKSDYDHLIELLEKESWEEANAKVLELKSKLQDADKLPKTANPPALPQEISKVDSDIRDVLLSQVAPAQASVPDWESLGRDLTEKEKVIQSRIPGATHQAARNYEAARLFIKNKNWEQAKEELEKIEWPEELAQDAREKIKVLDQLLQIRADTQGTK